MSEWVQLIIVRKDLRMSAGKVAVQCMHASLGAIMPGGIPMQDDIRDNWFRKSQAKIVCEARNWGHMMKATVIAEDMGLNSDYGFCIVNDECRTELMPENMDHTTTTCIGFIPMPKEKCLQISKKYQLFRG